VGSDPRGDGGRSAPAQSELETVASRLQQLIKSFSRLLAVDPGFRTHGLLTANVDLPARSASIS
jgi:hypothetical protein